MAVTDQSDNNTPRASSPTSAGPQNTNGSWSLTNGGGIFAAPISRGLGSDFYQKFKAAMVEIFKASNSNVEVALIDLDTINEPALEFSSLIVALRNKGSRGVAYHCLVLEATGEKIPAVYETMPNGSAPIEIYRVTSDAVDQIYQAKVKLAVQRTFPNEQNFYYTEATVIPRSFNLEDKFALHQIALNAGLAANTELEVRNSNFRDLDLSTVTNDSTLTINLGFARTVQNNVVGEPMRSDIQVNFTARRNTGKAHTLNTRDRDTLISSVSGYIDLVWNPVAQTAYNAYAPNMSIPSQKYSPNFVITNLASQQSYTPGSVLLAVMTATALNMNNNWFQAFKPSMMNSKQLDLRDIGALNIEANILNESGYGSKIDTKAADFNLHQLGQLVSKLIRPDLLTSLDCPDSGPQQWYMSVFAAAAGGNAEAYNCIYNAAERLTGGRFSRFFAKGGAMFVNSQRVHLGHWTDNTGTKRDIRDIDHLAVCNLVDTNNPEVIRDFSDTFWRTSFPEAQRLSARKAMLTKLTMDSAVFTGFAQRVTFSGAFTEALMKSIYETGFSVRINTPMTGSDFNDQRGVGSFANGAIMNIGNSFMNTAPAFVGGYQPSFGGNQGRW